MAKQGLRVSCSSLHDIINSDFSEPFDPFQEYLDGLKPWVKGEHPDYIEQLADRIVVQDDPDHFHTQEWFRYFFKKWLVAMVVAWVTLKVVNQNILILVGKGGIFKTTFFAYLLPPCLRQYFINDSTANYTTRTSRRHAPARGSSAWTSLRPSSARTRVPSRAPSPNWFSPSVVLTTSIAAS